MTYSSVLTFRWQQFGHHIMNSGMGQEYGVFCLFGGRGILEFGLSGWTKQALAIPASILITRTALLIFAASRLSFVLRQCQAVIQARETTACICNVTTTVLGYLACRAQAAPAVAERHGWPVAALADRAWAPLHIRRSAGRTHSYMR